jgi:CheY-like chemotaxis protein
MSACFDKAKPFEPANGDFSRREPPSSSKPTVLIVEDHDDTREMLCTLLSMWGCRVVEACNGLEAVEAASREQPALILMDGSLPLLDGLGATRLIREQGLGNQLKILALNGWGPIYRNAALAAGCDDCIQKPFDIGQLRSYVSSLFAFPLYASEQTANCLAR